jgi:nickel/cobalt transporter (NicO) family protein
LKLNESSVAAIDQSDELRAYPEDMLSSPLDDRSARFVYQVTDAPTAPPQAAPTQLGAAKSDGAFAALITLPRLNASVVLLALATALGLGALHALEPGHGKTAAAAYLVGSRATPWHALALGVTVTVMHTSSVFLLGLITLFASQFILPERLLPWLGLASGLIVIVLGLQMVWARLPRPGLQEATYGHAHDHHGPHSHTHDHHGHHHHHLPSALTGSRLGWRSVLAVGVSGGLLPCPAALVVLLSAIGLGRLGFGIALIVAFSAGLALVLTLIGLGMLYGGRLFARAEVGGYLKRFGVAPQLGAYLPAAGGLLVVLAGALLLYHSLPLLRIWQL